MSTVVETRDQKTRNTILVFKKFTINGKETDEYGVIPTRFTIDRGDMERAAGVQA